MASRLPFRASRSSAGEPEPDEPRDLVERLAGRVVERLPEEPVLERLGHVDQHRVTP
jgi:hypothetical protein